MVICDGISATKCFMEGGTSIGAGILMIIAGVFGVIAAMRRHYFITKLSSSFFMFVSVICFIMGLVYLYEFVTGTNLTFKSSDAIKLDSDFKDDRTEFETMLMMSFFFVNTVLHCFWWYVWNQMSKLFEFVEGLVEDREDSLYYEKEEDKQNGLLETTDVERYDSSIDITKLDDIRSVGKIHKKPGSTDPSEYLF